MLDSLFTALSEKLFPVQTEGASAALSDPELETEARAQAVYGLLFPEKNLRGLAKNLRVMNEHCRLHALLTKNHIPYVILKGYASASYYPEPLQRALGDVDFLVRPEDREKTDALLLETGYEAGTRLSNHHWNYERFGVDVELHWKVNGTPEGSMEGPIEKYLSDIFERGRTVTTAAGEMVIPSDFHHGLVMLLHTARHMTSTGMGFRHVCDWAVFVHRMTDFEGTFKESLQTLGLWRYACMLTLVCERYLGLEKQTWIKRTDFTDDDVDALAEDIYGAGNMGRKKPSYEYFFLPDITTDTNEKRRGKLYYFFRKLNHSSYSVFPSAERHKILLPFCWIYLVFRYILRLLRRKRKYTEVFRLMKSSDKRNRLYSSLKLFESEL